MIWEKTKDMKGKKNFKIVSFVCLLIVFVLLGIIIIMQINNNKVADYESLNALGMNLEEIEIKIAGLTEEYNFIYISDMHVIVENEEIAPENLQLIQQRRDNTRAVLGEDASEKWSEIAETLDRCNVDAILLGGDMLDYASTTNIECLKRGLDNIETPVMYVRADHDYAPFWCTGLEREYTDALHKEIDGYHEVMLFEFPQLCVIGINNSTANISENAVKELKRIISIGKPIILLTHVPLQSKIDASLSEQSIAGWGSALVWGEGGNYVPDENTQELLDLVYSEDSLIQEVVCGHLHFSWDGYLTENTHQHVFSPACNGFIGTIRVMGEE